MSGTVGRPRSMLVAFAEIGPSSAPHLRIPVHDAIIVQSVVKQDDRSSSPEYFAPLHLEKYQQIEHYGMQDFMVPPTSFARTTQDFMAPPTRLAHALQGIYEQQESGASEPAKPKRNAPCRAVLFRMCGMTTYEHCRRRFIDDDHYWETEETFARLACTVIRDYNIYEKEDHVDMLDATLPSIAVLEQLLKKRQATLDADRETMSRSPSPTVRAAAYSTPVATPPSSLPTVQSQQDCPRSTQSPKTMHSAASNRRTTRSASRNTLPPSHRTRSKQGPKPHPQPTRVEKTQKTRPRRSTRVSG